MGTPQEKTETVAQEQSAVERGLVHLASRLGDVPLAYGSGRELDRLAPHWVGFYGLATDLNALISSALGLRKWTEKQRRRGKK